MDMVRIEVRSGAPHKQRLDAIVLPMLAGRELTETGALLRAEDAPSREAIRAFLRRRDIVGDFGQIAALYHVPGVFADRIVFVGVGEERKLTLNKLRELAARVARWLDQGGSRDVALYFADLHVRGAEVEDKARAIAEGIWLGLYRFDRYKSEKKAPSRPLREVQLMVPARRFIRRCEPVVAHVRAACAGVYLAREIANEPPNVCTPSWLAGQAEALAEAYEAIAVEVWDEQALAEKGMRGLLAVGQGARNAPRMIVLRYSGGDDDEPPVALVGKGLTFDSGGVCVKPPKGMDEMKFDMAGAAAVLGVFKAAAEAGWRVNLLGVIPAAENMMGGAAYKPGDVIRAYNGTTIEVLNTDAEGRIALADALAWAAEQDPAEIVDIATLTGACVVALGDQAAGLIGNDPGLVRRLRRAGEASGDRAWPLPLYDEYQQKIDSEIADIKNIGDGGAGAITAACFLSRFVGRAKWAHLDIAGVAWTTKGTPIAAKGATGAGVRLLAEYLARRAEGAADDEA